MKSLYESLLDTDFDVNDDQTIVQAIQAVINASGYNIRSSVELVDDKYVFKFGAMLILDDEIIDIIEQSTVRKLIFEGPVIIDFLKRKSLDGYDITAESLHISTSGKLVIKDCQLRCAEDVEFRGIGKRQCQVILKHTTVYGVGCNIEDCNLSLEDDGQLALDLHINIINPTTKHIKWLKQNNIPMNRADIDKGIVPTFRISPLDMLNADYNTVNLVSIYGKKLKYTYNFYNDQVEREPNRIAEYDLGECILVIYPPIA